MLDLDKKSLNNLNNLITARSGIQQDTNEQIFDLYKKVDIQNINTIDRSKWRGDFKQRLDQRIKKRIKNIMTQNKKLTELDAKNIIHSALYRMFYDSIYAHGSRDKYGEYKKDNKATDLDVNACVYLMNTCKPKNIYNQDNTIKDINLRTIKHDLKAIDDEPIGKKKSMLIDVGGENGILEKEIAGWLFKNIIIDHHASNAPTSTTQIIYRILEELGAIPEDQKVAIKKYVDVINIHDSYFSEAAALVYDNYERTMLGLADSLSPEDMINLFSLKNETGYYIVKGPLVPISKTLDNHLIQTKKGKRNLDNIYTKKRFRKSKAEADINLMMNNDERISISGEDFLIFGPDVPIGDTYKAYAAHLGLGIFKINNNGSLFLLHQNGIPSDIENNGKLVHKVMLILNPEDDKYEENFDQIISSIGFNKEKVEDIINEIKEKA